MRSPYLAALRVAPAGTLAAPPSLLAAGALLLVLLRGDVALATATIAAWLERPPPLSLPCVHILLILLV